MKALFENINWFEAVGVIWTAIILPILAKIGSSINEYAKAKKIDKYTEILQQGVLDAVKDVYETIVKDIKGTDEWTPEKQNEIKEIAKNKAIYSLTAAAYKALKEANEDFEDYIDGLIGTALYDLKHEK